VFGKRIGLWGGGLEKSPDHRLRVSGFTGALGPCGWFIDILTIHLLKELHCYVSRSGAGPAKEAWSRAPSATITERWVSVEALALNDWPGLGLTGCGTHY
jgi:hypothetical protein